MEKEGKEENGRMDSSMCSLDNQNGWCVFFYHKDGIAQGRSMKRRIAFPSPIPSVMDCR